MNTQNLRTPFIALALAAGLLVSACKDGRQQQGAMGPGGPVEVNAVTVAPQPVRFSEELPGRTSAFRIAEVRPQIGGILQKRLFTEGSDVKAGQQLYQIDPATYQAAFASAQAALARAEAAEYSARLKAERYRNLVRSQAVSVQEQVETEAAWKQAAAEVAATKAAVETARINLEYTRITAPISGRIGKSMVSEGALVTAQQAGALAVIQQLDPLYVDVSQSAGETMQLKKRFDGPKSGGQPLTEVRVLLEDGTAYARPGSLEFSDTTVDESTGTVILRATVPNPETELLPGLFVRARLTRQQEEQAIVIPQASIVRNNRGQAMVMLVNKQNTVEGRPVATGQNLGDRIVITEGLAAGEQLIVAGLQKIKPGVPVKIAAAQPQTGKQAPASGQPTTGKVE
jgi:membrane fusion protein (multidrug efflux system)